MLSIFRPKTIGYQQARANLKQERRIARRHLAAVKKARANYGGKTGLKLHLGCGPNVKPGWVNVDFSPKADLQLDLREPLPFAGGSCSLIYSEHFFEHVDFPDAVYTLLAECLRVLGPEGIFSVGVPDTEWPILEYGRVKQENYFTTAKKIWHPPWCETEMDHINYHFRQRGQHLYAYDEKTLCHVLTKAGFAQARRRKFDPGLDLANRELGTLYAEARKAA
jgi:predicted SAM-dependent methyltransferase